MHASLFVSGTSIPDCDRPGHRISLHFRRDILQFCHIFAAAAGKETSGRSTGLPRQCAHWLAMTRLFGLGRLTIPPSASPTPPFTQGRLSAAAGLRADKGIGPYRVRWIKRGAFRCGGGFGRPMAAPTDASGVRRWTEHTKPGPSRLRRPRRDTKYKTFGPWQDCTPFSECAPHPLPAQPARKRLPHGTQGGLLSAAWFPT